MTYNQAAHSGQVRIGNWFEELKLKEETGIRFYPSPKDKKNSLLTKARCIVHTDQVLPKDYTTVNRESLKIPQNHPEYHGPVRGPKAMGPRRLLLERAIKSEVEEEFSAKEKSNFEETRKIDYTSLNKASFAKLNFTPSLKENDASSRIPTKSAAYITEPPVTYYSHSVQHGKANNFPCTFVGSTNPFKKSAAFSADIRKELVAPLAETNQRPRPLPTLLELRAMTDLRSRLIAQVQKLLGTFGAYYPDGSAVRSIISAVWRGSNSESCPIRDLVEILTETFGVDITQQEQKALLAAMDVNSDGNISLPQLTNFFRPSPPIRRLVRICEPILRSNLNYNLIQHFIALFRNCWKRSLDRSLTVLMN